MWTKIKLEFKVARQYVEESCSFIEEIKTSVY